MQDTVCERFAIEHATVQIEPPGFVVELHVTREALHVRCRKCVGQSGQPDADCVQPVCVDARRTRPDDAMLIATVTSRARPVVRTLRSVLWTPMRGRVTGASACGHATSDVGWAAPTAVCVALERRVDQALNIAQQRRVFRRHQRDGATCVARAARAAHAVHVIRGDQRQVEADERQLRDVESACRDVGRHQHAHASALKSSSARERSGSLLPWMTPAGMPRPSRSSPTRFAPLRLAEHQRLVRVLMQDVSERIALAVRGDLMHDVRYGSRDHLLA